MGDFELHEPYCENVDLIDEDKFINLVEKSEPKGKVITYAIDLMEFEFKHVVVLS